MLYSSYYEVVIDLKSGSFKQEKYTLTPDGLFIHAKNQDNVEVEKYCCTEHLLNKNGIKIDEDLRAKCEELLIDCYSIRNGEITGFYASSEANPELEINNNLKYENIIEYYVKYNTNLELENSYFEFDNKTDFIKALEKYKKGMIKEFKNPQDLEDFNDLVDCLIEEINEYDFSWGTIGSNNKIYLRFNEGSVNITKFYQGILTKYTKTKETKLEEKYGKPVSMIEYDGRNKVVYHEKDGVVLIDKRGDIK